ncbi:MAG TPA: PaaX family transcriptional regulator [Myxococcota bacterium]|nr:PaaX family transcriptional regulator [Myxococcota bacterium]
MTPSPKSTILDLLQTLHGRSLPVRALVEAGALFGLAENGMRVALARLVARGLVERDGPGRYRLAAGAQPISRRVGGWTTADLRAVRWDGAWLGALTQAAAGDRSQRRGDARALAFLGFARLAPGLWVRPDNLRGGVAETRAALLELGLDRHVPVLRLSELDEATEARARALWDATALVAAQKQMREALEKSAARLARLAPAAAMVETFLVGGRAIRQIALDPCLPEAIAPEHERRALVAAMREYDRAGRACWREFMRSHDAPHRAAPANLAGLSGEARAAALGSPR